MEFFFSSYDNPPFTLFQKCIRVKPPHSLSYVGIGQSDGRTDMLISRNVSASGKKKKKEKFMASLNKY